MSDKNNNTPAVPTSALLSRIKNMEQMHDHNSRVLVAAIRELEQTQGAIMLCLEDVALGRKVFEINKSPSAIDWVSYKNEYNKMMQELEEKQQAEEAASKLSKDIEAAYGKDVRVWGDNEHSKA